MDTKKQSASKEEKNYVWTKKREPNSFILEFFLIYNVVVSEIVEDVEKEPDLADYYNQVHDAK